MSSNSSSYNFHLFPNYAIPLTVLNGLSSVIGTVGNILVIIIIIKTPGRFERVTDRFILSLACADFIVVVVMEPLFTYHINYYTDTDGTTFDTVLDVTGYVSNLASIGSMLCVTFDRLVAIRFPFKYEVYLSKGKVTFMITIVWVCSTTFGLVFKLTNMYPAILWGVCLLLLLGTILSYPYIFHVARKQERLQITSVGERETTNSETTSNKHAKNNINRGRILVENKSTKTVLIVVGFFGICWVPILIYTQVKPTERNQSNKFLPGFFVVYTLSMLNSTVNPFIYCLRNRRYRKKLKSVLCRRAAVGSKQSVGV